MKRRLELWETVCLIIVLAFAGVAFGAPHVSALAPYFPVEWEGGPPHKGKGVFWHDEGDAPCVARVYRSNPARNDLKWTVGDANGPTMVFFWTNAPGHDQTEHMFIVPAGTIKSIRGGGTQLVYPQGCEVAAEAKYAASPTYTKDGIPIQRLNSSLNELEYLGLVNY